MQASTARITILILSLIGIGIAGYLTYAYVTDTPVVCTGGIFHGCGEVQESEYAQFLGIPIPVYGLAFYLFLVGNYAFLWDVHRRHYAWRSLVWFSTLFGFLFSAYLTFLEAFVIEAWCMWCVGSALVSTAIFIVSSMVFVSTRNAHDVVGPAV